MAKRITLFDTMYTPDLTKALKTCKDDTLHCKMNSVGCIYIASGCFLVKVTPGEYNQFIRPVTQRDPGNWVLSKGEVVPGKEPLDGEKLLDNSSYSARHTLTAAPMLFPKEKKIDTLLGFYSSDMDFVSCYRYVYTTMFKQDVYYKSVGSNKPLVVFKDTVPIALVMPVRIQQDSALASAVRAWFEAPSKEEVKHD